MSERRIAYWPGQENDWMDFDGGSWIAICIGTLTGTKPHYAYCRLSDGGGS